MCAPPWWGVMLCGDELCSERPHLNSWLSESEASQFSLLCFLAALTGYWSGPISSLLRQRRIRSHCARPEGLILMKSWEHQEDVSPAVYFTHSLIHFVFAEGKWAHSEQLLHLFRQLCLLYILHTQSYSYFLIVQGAQTAGSVSALQNKEDLWLCCVWLAGCFLPSRLWQQVIQANRLKRSHAHYSRFKISRRTCLSAILTLLWCKCSEDPVAPLIQVGLARVVKLQTMSALCKAWKQTCFSCL